DVDVTRAVGEEELPSNVLEVLVSSLKDDSLSRSMVRVVSNEGSVSRCRIMSTRVAKRESSPLTMYMTSSRDEEEAESGVIGTIEIEVDPRVGPVVDDDIHELFREDFPDHVTTNRSLEVMHRGLDVVMQ
nr:hypothetical protein [Tanacetum cinerariifolium]